MKGTIISANTTWGKTTGGNGENQCSTFTVRNLTTTTKNNIIDIATFTPKWEDRISMG
jgi:hypothetical protein